MKDPQRDLLCMTKNEFFWIKSPFTTPDFKLRFHKPPEKGSRHLILLKDLGFGTEGRVWMVCCPSGFVGALKFQHTVPTQKGLVPTKLHVEANNWQIVCGEGMLYID